MAFESKTDKTDKTDKTVAPKTGKVGVATTIVEPTPAETMDDLGIGVTDPYPTGDPKVPQTYAEINGLVPVGTGVLVPGGAV